MFVLLLLFPSFTNTTDASELSKPLTFDSATRDYWPTEGWMNSTPEEQGMDSVRLQQMVDHITDEVLDVHSVIVIRHGYVVLEEYPAPWQGQGRTESLYGTHYLYSVTKSFTSSLVGLAIDNGFIDNTSQTLLSFFPNHTVANNDEQKEQLTLRNLLTMRSGLPWDETSVPFTSPENGIWQLDNNQSGGVQFMLDRPMEYAPDEIFHYNTGASHLLSGIVQETSNMSSLEFANEYLFTPLGVNTSYWWTDRQGVNLGGYDLQLRPLDMAKFGYLFLNNGTWDDEQVISSSWVNESTTTVTAFSGTSGYAYQWWTMPDLGVYFAAGLYGQYIFVSPEHDLVAVFTSGYSIGDTDENPSLFRNFIIDAVTDVYDEMSLPLEVILPVFAGIVIVSLVVIVKIRSRSGTASI